MGATGAGGATARGGDETAEGLDMDDGDLVDVVLPP